MFVFFFNDTATTEIYTLSLHDALPICVQRCPDYYLPGHLRGRTTCAGVPSGSIGCSPNGPQRARDDGRDSDRRHTRSEEHTSELQSRQYLVCRLLLEKKKKDRSKILSD